MTCPCAVVVVFFVFCFFMEPSTSCWHFVVVFYLSKVRLVLGWFMQSMANNMLARALQISKHEILTAPTLAHMSLSIAELQLAQAQRMPNAANECSTAIVLLRSAEQHLEAAATQCKKEENPNAGMMMTKIRGAKERVTLASAEVQLASGRASDAIKSLEHVICSSGDIQRRFSVLDATFVRAKIVAGDVAGAAEHLLLCDSSDELIEEESLNAWMQSFEQVLNVCDGSISIKNLVAAAISYTEAHGQGDVNRIGSLLRTMLSRSGSSETKKNHQPAVLAILAADEIVAAVFKVGRRDVH